MARKKGGKGPILVPDRKPQGKWALAPVGGCNRGKIPQFGASPKGAAKKGFSPGWWLQPGQKTPFTPGCSPQPGLKPLPIYSRPPPLLPQFLLSPEAKLRYTGEVLPDSRAPPLLPPSLPVAPPVPSPRRRSAPPVASSSRRRAPGILVVAPPPDAAASCPSRRRPTPQPPRRAAARRRTSSSSRRRSLLLVARRPLPPPHGNRRPLPPPLFLFYLFFLGFLANRFFVGFILGLG